MPAAPPIIIDSMGARDMKRSPYLSTLVDAVLCSFCSAAFLGILFGTAHLVHHYQMMLNPYSPYDDLDFRAGGVLLIPLILGLVYGMRAIVSFIRFFVRGKNP